MTSVTRENGQLAYQVFGTGSEILLAFHGFGQDGTIFKEWADITADRFTIYAFDLFYHGQSIRPYENLPKAEWKDWVVQFLKQEGIDRFSILGYSLGGRFAISTALLFSTKVNELFLVAPDGIFLTPWFKLATTPGLRSVFKYFMMHPDRLERTLAFNDRSRVINKYVADFARKEMGDLDNRKRVYRSWNFFKTLGYAKKTLITHFSAATYKKTLIVGDKDHIIKPSGILPIIEKTDAFQVHHLPLKHHQLAKPHVAELLRADA